METYDVIVIGTGGVGSVAAMHLVGRGVRVLGLDRFPPGHDRGSSHGQTRVIRLAYFEHPDYVPLLRRAYELWADLESVSGKKLYYPVGLLQIGPPHGEIIQGVRDSAQQHRLAIENLSPEQVAERFPAFRCAADHEAVFEQNAGYLLVEPCVVAHATEAIRRGATFRCGEAVQTWRADGNGVHVTTDCETYSADRLVITAGAWAGNLLADLKFPLTVLRKPLYWFAPAENITHDPRTFPCFLYDLPAGCFYGFPQLDERGVKVAQHSGGTPVNDPLKVSRDLDPEDLKSVARFVEGWLPSVTTQLVDHATCMYTMSANSRFIVDRHPEHPQVCFAAGLSGHGFKFTTVLGEILCDLALRGASRLPIEFLSR